MAFSLKVSNKLTDLSMALCKALYTQQNDVFQPWYIVTQTAGMENWLKMQMAEYLGIAANYKFLKPNDSIFKIYQALGDSYSESLTIHHLVWLFYKILGEDDFKSRYADIAAYFTTADPDADIKRLGLAKKTADLIDQYQIYRPEMIAQWNLVSILEKDIDEWQEYLWIRAKDIIGDKSLPDRTIMGQAIFDRLRDGSTINILREKIPAIHVFGLSIFTAYHLELFNAVGQFIDIHFYLLNPAPSQYWIDDKSQKQLAFLQRNNIDTGEGLIEQGNQLLLSWGRLIKNTFGLLLSNEALLNSYEVVGEEDPGDQTLLSLIQQDIFYNRTKEDRDSIPLILLEDGSISINSCYSAIREVEVLYNYLVRLIDENQESLSARDIVVMVSDIDAYAPYIRAVFDNAPFSFFYTIADENVTEGQTVSALLLAIMELKERSFKAESVLQLLESPFIRRHFNIVDVNLLRKITDLANIRFGISGDEDDDTVLVSWNYGLDRIIYGLCMNGEEPFIDQDGKEYYPLDIVEGQGAADVIRFCYFVKLIIQTIKDRRAARTLVEWGAYLDNVLQQIVFLADDGENQEDYMRLRSTLETYNDLQDALVDRISYEVFLTHFKDTLAGNNRNSRFGIGGITFCSLIPMRSIPFKVVAVLGLNYDKFPRQDKRVDFDLMQKQPRKGDRNTKDNDKHLFLETLLSADKYFYVSYQGQSVKDNTTIPPSVVVEELLHYIQEGCDVDNAAELLTIKHPLHRFSHKYAPDKIPLYNYIDQKPQLTSTWKSSIVSENSFEKEIPLSAFLRFLKKPIESYYREVLGIDLHRDHTQLRETELFAMEDSDNLYALKMEMVTSGEQLENLQHKWHYTGALPLKNMAMVAWDSLFLETEFLRTQFGELTQGLTPSFLEIDVCIGEHRILGTIEAVYGTKIIVLSSAKFELKHLLDAFIKTLLVSANTISAEVYFISNKQQGVYKLENIAYNTAIEFLQSYVQLYQRAIADVLFFDPDWLSPELLMKVEQMDSNDLLVEVDKSIARMQLYNEYLKLELKNSGGVSSLDAEHYRELVTVLLSPLLKSCPDYFKS